MKLAAIPRILKILKLQLVIWLLIFGTYFACRAGLLFWEGSSELGIIDLIIGPELILLTFLLSRHNALPNTYCELFCQIFLFSMVLGVTYGFDNFSLRKESAYRKLGPTVYGLPIVWRVDCYEYGPSYKLSNPCNSMKLQLVTKYGQSPRSYLTSELRKMDSEKVNELLGEGNKILELREIYGE